MAIPKELQYTDSYRKLIEKQQFNIFNAVFFPQVNQKSLDFEYDAIYTTDNIKFILTKSEDQPNLIAELEEILTETYKLYRPFSITLPEYHNNGFMFLNDDFEPFSWELLSIILKHCAKYRDTEKRLPLHLLAKEIIKSICRTKYFEHIFKFNFVFMIKYPHDVVIEIDFMVQKLYNIMMYFREKKIIDTENFISKFYRSLVFYKAQSVADDLEKLSLNQCNFNDVNALNFPFMNFDEAAFRSSSGVKAKLSNIQKYLLNPILNIPLFRPVRDYFFRSINLPDMLCMIEPSVDSIHIFTHPAFGNDWAKYQMSKSVERLFNNYPGRYQLNCAETLLKTKNYVYSHVLYPQFSKTEDKILMICSKFAKSDTRCWYLSETRRILNLTFDLFASCKKLITIGLVRNVKFEKQFTGNFEMFGKLFNYDTTITEINQIKHDIIGSEDKAAYEERINREIKMAETRQKKQELQLLKARAQAQRAEMEMKKLEDLLKDTVEPIRTMITYKTDAKQLKAEIKKQKNIEVKRATQKHRQGDSDIHISKKGKKSKKKNRKKTDFDD